MLGIVPVDEEIFRAPMYRAHCALIFLFSCSLSLFANSLKLLPTPMMKLFVLLPRESTRSAVLPMPVVRLSICPSVTLRYRGHIGWNSAKIISRLISLTISLSADSNITDLLQTEHPTFSRNRSGVRKMSIFDI